MAPSSSRPLSVSRSASRAITSPETSKEGSVERFSCARFSSTLNRSALSIGLISVSGPRRGHHDLSAAIEQLVDDVLKLLFRLLAAHEFQIVDQQDVDRAEFVLKGHRVLALDGLYELVAKALGRQVEHIGFRCTPLHFPGDGVLQMRLAEADAGVQVERIEAALLREYGFGNLNGSRMRHPIRRSDDEAVEGVAGIEWRALKTVDVGAPHRLCWPGRLYLHPPGLADQQL